MSEQDEILTFENMLNDITGALEHVWENTPNAYLVERYREYWTELVRLAHLGADLERIPPGCSLYFEGRNNPRAKFGPWRLVKEGDPPRILGSGKSADEALAARLKYAFCWSCDQPFDRKIIGHERNPNGRELSPIYRLVCGCPERQPCN